MLKSPLFMFVSHFLLLPVNFLFNIRLDKLFFHHQYHCHLEMQAKPRVCLISVMVAFFITLFIYKTKIIRKLEFYNLWWGFSLMSKDGVGCVTTKDQQCHKWPLNLIISNLLRIYLFSSTRHRFIIDSAFSANSLFTHTKYLLYFSTNQLNTRLKLTVADQFTFTRASRFWR